MSGNSISVLKNEDKKSINKKLLIDIIISVIFVACLVVIWQIIAPFQLDNDNIYLKTIFSGEMTGIQEFRSCHIGIISGTFLSILYKLLPSIPWFGIFLFTSVSIPLILLILLTLQRCNKVYEYIICLGIFGIIYNAFFYRFYAQPQYTIATGFVGSASLLLLGIYTFSNDTKIYTFFALAIVFSIWSMGIRDKAFYMFLPFIGLLLLFKFFTIDKKNRYKHLLFSLAYLLLILLIFISNKMAYSSSEWSMYKEYNSNRESILDYEGLPDYDKYSYVYEQNGITRSSYNAFLYHYNIILDSNINEESMHALSEIDISKQSSLSEKLIDTFKTIVKRNLLEYEDRPLNILVFSLYAFTVLLILFRKKYICFAYLGISVFARTFDWIYLVWNGRYMFRVTQIIYMAELVMLIALILGADLWKMWDEKERGSDKKNQEKVFNIHPVFLIMIIFMIAISIRFGLPVTKKIYEQTKAFRELSVSFKELERYMLDHPENNYFFDMSHLYYTEDALAIKKPEYENYVYMGSWMVNSPWYNNKLMSWGVEDTDKDLIEKDNLYIVYQVVDFDDRSFLDEYYEEHFPGSSIELVDTYTTSNNFTYEILKPTY